jgi:hypothetical protein
MGTPFSIFLWNHHTDFLDSLVNVHSNQQCRRIPPQLHILTNISFLFLILGIELRASAC